MKIEQAINGAPNIIQKIKSELGIYQYPKRIEKEESKTKASVAKSTRTRITCLLKRDKLRSLFNKCIDFYIILAKDYKLFNVEKVHCKKLLLMSHTVTFCDFY